MLKYGWRLQMGVIGLASCFLSFPSKTFFESVTVWESETGQRVYGMADVHNIEGGTPGIVFDWNHYHQGEILFGLGGYLRSKKKQDVLAIIEDSWGYKGANESVQQLIEKFRFITMVNRDPDSPLQDLLAKLEMRDFPVVNAERRFLKSWGLVSVQPSIPVNSEGEFPTWCKVSGRDIVQEYEQVKAEIEHYTENPLLQYYRDTVRFVHTPSIAAVLESVRTNQTNIVQYINEKIRAEQRLRFKRALQHFDAPYVDARVLHLVCTRPAIKNVFCLLGATHIYQIGETLKTWRGFKEVAHVGVRRAYPYEPITFDLNQENKPQEMVRLKPLESREFQLILADVPQRLMAGSYS